MFHIHLEDHPPPASLYFYFGNSCLNIEKISTSLNDSLIALIALIAQIRLNKVVNFDIIVQTLLLKLPNDAIELKTCVNISGKQTNKFSVKCNHQNTVGLFNLASASTSQLQK